MKNTGITYTSAERSPVILPEMLADRFTVDGIANELYQILPGGCMLR